MRLFSRFRSRRCRFLVWGAVGIFLAYALASGPAVWLMQRQRLSAEVVETVFLGPYSPLVVVTEIVPGGTWLLKRYIEWWEQTDPGS